MKRPSSVACQRRARRGRSPTLLLHGLVGATSGYFVLHPAAMVIHHLFAVGIENWSLAIALSFDASHMSMAVYFVGLGALGGVLQGFYVYRLALLNEQLRYLAQTDDLTGLCNRRHLFYLLDREVRRARRNGGALSLAILDIDHFKSYNDRHGHPAGDDLLHVLAQLLCRSVRAVDLVARYGGEEFVVVLPDAGLTAARDIVDRLRISVRAHPFAGASTQPLGKVTVSVGLAELGAEALSSGQLLRRADTALYAAKRSGRDGVRVWSETALDLGVPQRLSA